MTAETDLLPLPWQCETAMCPALYTAEQVRACVSSATEALRAEVAEARGGWHMANGTAELAMKHRDAAEARAERLAEALRKAREDINWMLNSRQFLNSFVFDYIDAALDQEGGNGFWPEMTKSGGPDWTGFDG